MRASFQATRTRFKEALAKHWIGNSRGRAINEPTNVEEQAARDSEAGRRVASNAIANACAGYGGKIKHGDDEWHTHIFSAPTLEACSFRDRHEALKQPVIICTMFTTSITAQSALRRHHQTGTLLHKHLSNNMCSNLAGISISNKKA